MTRSLLKRLAFFVAAGLVVAATGCGPRSGSITGKVSIDGKPVKGGLVTFTNNSGGASGSSNITEDGSYAIPRLDSGEYTITVSTESVNPAFGGGSGSSRPGGPGQKSKEGGSSTPGADGEGIKGSRPSMMPDLKKLYVPIPAHYSDPAKSGLKFSHPGGVQTHDIPLTGK